jgi:transposase
MPKTNPTPANLQKHIVARVLLNGESRQKFEREYGLSRQSVHQYIQKWRDQVCEDWLDPRMALSFEELLKQMEA